MSVSVCELFVFLCPDGIVSADGAISPEFFTDFQNGELGQTGYVGRYGASHSPEPFNMWK